MNIEPIEKTIVGKAFYNHASNLRHGRFSSLIEFNPQRFTESHITPRLVIKKKINV